MKERIKQIMNEENLTPSLFADKLNIGRAVISHILNGRNNPSLDVVTRILDTIDYIDADWLLSGKGSMRRADSIQKVPYGAVSANLFDTKVTIEQTPLPENYTTVASMPEDAVSNAAETTSVAKESSRNAPQTMINTSVGDKRASRVIIYYSDNTFQSFNPDSTPL